ncbi:MAG: hypothetical protein II644_01680, partial [Paludibacteraceae bacterium]|nr:hypothetical protein [Paludibacteraceae bacterium]
MQNYKKIPENASFCKKNIEALPPPAKVTIPLSQHIGAPAVACVNVGDSVTLGQ